MHAEKLMSSASHIVALDHRHVWHPFTQMRDWLRREPIVLQSGEGAVLEDIHGRQYLDANSSIWTNLHGHRHPRIHRAIDQQLRQVAHTSALGFANVPASLLASQLVQAARWGLRKPTLNKVFFSDDGSTAMEVALKLSYESTRRLRGIRKPRFLSLQGAYHGDTVGAVSLGHIDLFHKNFGGLLFSTDSVMAPYCYRCPYNRAKPERADARETRRCRWECLGAIEQAFSKAQKKKRPYTAFCVEPLMQGAAGMIAQPQGWLKRASSIVRAHGAQLIADEVMTGFGRTGTPKTTSGRTAVFACQSEGVRPDFLAVAKGLTGGYLPMAATLTTEEVFEAFLGEYDEFKTFFHGHSFTGNQLGAAAGLESLKMLNEAASVRQRLRLERWMREALSRLWDLDFVGDIRQVGLVCGIELVKDWRTRCPFELKERAGIRVCEVMAQHGVLTRPIGSVVVLMPPYCTNQTQLEEMVSALRKGILALKA